MKLVNNDIVKNLTEEEKEVLRFIPVIYSQNFATIYAYARKWLNLSKKQFEQIINSLLMKGYVYEPKPGEYERVEVVE